eukprot:4274223-Lingulodinium_polyedra.AAC.1
MDSPVPMGDHRARRLDSGLLTAVASAAAERTLGRTGGQVAQYLARARGWRFKKVSRTVANHCADRRVLQYAAACKEAFGRPEVRILSVAFDGTRMSKRET